MYFHFFFFFVLRIGARHQEMHLPANHPCSRPHRALTASQANPSGVGGPVLRPLSQKQMHSLQLTSSYQCPEQMFEAALLD